MSAMEGIYFDELSKIRVLQPDVLMQTEELKDECKQFVDSKSMMPTLNIDLKKKQDWFYLFYLLHT